MTAREIAVRRKMLIQDLLRLLRDARRRVGRKPQ